VLCVARFEPLKNQLNLIKAINKTNLKLTLIGRASPNSEAFFQACKQEARHNPNIIFIEHLSQSDLKVYYEKAKVHVLPSWFETTGLSTLEAAACGCNIVVTDKGDTKEYFGDYAYFCRPESEQSILEAVLKANAKENNFEMRDKILRSYNWGVTAQRTFEAYKKALKINEN
ncbi:MAG TPA: glycosyltransferase, partial [Daejeonella sp.]|nr:glycosyltransferase [Daejeonella sp.]